MIDEAAVAWDYLHRWLNENDERFVDITISTDTDGQRVWEITFFPENDPLNKDVFESRAETFALAVEDLVAKGKLDE